MIEDGNIVMRAIQRVDLISDLYTNEDIEQYQQVEPSEIIDIVIQELDVEIKDKRLFINIESTTAKTAKFIGSKVWLILAIKECIHDLIRHCRDNEQIRIKLHLHCYFLTIKIENCGLLKEQGDHRESVVYDEEFFEKRRNHKAYDRNLFKKVNESLDFDLFLSSQIIELHHGNIRYQENGNEKTILIELPIGGGLGTSGHDGLEQAKLYARDLAILREMNSK